jgi:hypothetical protein
MKKLLHIGIFFLFSLSCYSQNTGIGITTPRSLLHIHAGPSGNFFPFSPLAVEGNNNTYINILTPDANESGVLFGTASDAASGGIVYNSASTVNGLQFRTNGNATRMVLSAAGNLGIATINPTEKLQVAGNIKANSFRYTTPKTMYQSIPGSAFRGERSYDTVFISLGYGGASMFSLLPGKRLIAPVQLPQNAIMQNMTVYINDNSTQNNAEVTLYRKTITSTFFPDNIGTLNSSGSSGIITLYTTPVNTFGGSNVIDNLNYTYYISVGSNGSTGLWTSIVEILTVIIEYTLTETN